LRQARRFENRQYARADRLNRRQTVCRLRVFGLQAGHAADATLAMSTPWWRGATIYQIYPRSFADATGDGTGDLAGITRHLPYVASLGVNGLWLCPFFPSPMRDFGYDVSDHLGVDPLFGTLADFDTLVTEAHRLGLKVVIDQVWSHTAAEHPWFEESRASRDNPKADWYVWAEARPDGSPPNNWQSWMGGPAWRWEPRRRQYHLHNFLPQMPDLNFHCLAVQEEILAVARFWLERGVDGFRLDTANLYFHSRGLQDNPPAPAGAELPVLMQLHRHNADQPETPAFFERLRPLLDAYDAFAVAEVGGAEPLLTMAEYTRGRDRLHTAYSFALLGDAPSPQTLARHMADWQQGLAAQAWPSWAFSNHDVPRVASRWGGRVEAGFAFGGAAASATAAGSPALWMALLLVLRGTVFIYQGEELGLPQSEVPFEQLQDPFGRANWPVNKGRDGCRTPMPWRADHLAGGFTAGRPWLPVDAAHLARAMDRQEADPGSLLHLTRRLLALRRAHPALRLGNFETLHASAGLLVLRRTHGDDTVLAAFNLGPAEAWHALDAAPQPRAEAVALQGASLQGEQLQLPPFSALILPLHAQQLHRPQEPVA
jgi:alpha-glucosidase